MIDKKVNKKSDDHDICLILKYYLILLKSKDTNPLYWSL